MVNIEPYFLAASPAGGKYGILMPPRDPEAMAPALTRIRGNGRTGRKDHLRVAASRFTYSACADGYAQFFRSLV
jgi:hypothetical protein